MTNTYGHITPAACAHDKCVGVSIDLKFIQLEGDKSGNYKESTRSQPARIKLSAFGAPKSSAQMLPTVNKLINFHNCRQAVN